MVAQSNQLDVWSNHVRGHAITGCPDPNKYNPALPPPPALGTTQIADASASLEGLSLLDQVTDAASASAIATDEATFVTSQAAASPLP